MFQPGHATQNDKLHFKAGKNQQSNVIGGETDETKSMKIFDDNNIAEAQEAAKGRPVSAITVTQQ